jgi:hypothetical protein
MKFLPHVHTIQGPTARQSTGPEGRYQVRFRSARVRVVLVRLGLGL